jgi:hypothetical protein
MNGSNFFQTLESRTLFTSVLTPALDPGDTSSLKPATQMEQQLPPGGGATVDTVNGSGSSTGTLQARSRFSSEIIRVA